MMFDFYSYDQAFVDRVETNEWYYHTVFPDTKTGFLFWTAVRFVSRRVSR